MKTKEEILARLEYRKRIRESHDAACETHQNDTAYWEQQAITETQLIHELEWVLS